ncbi:FAD-dependent oxidoreductase [Candidatus Sumerlaeota bacterium]|nr:FAD-dependent oxidoreductase [Candidatus Sumerlaeota bacterium]
MTMYDLIIIGAGPAGITAGVYAARKRMNFLILTKDVGGQAGWSGDVENYIGYQFISGPELVEKFREHLQKFDVEIREGEPATLIKRENNLIHAQTEQGSYEARTVIVASGRNPRKLGAEGEEQYRNRGVTYCATCDGPLFADKDVAVVGGGNSGFDAVLQLVKIARHIHVVEIAPEIRADSIMVEKARESGIVSIHTSSRVKSFFGDMFLKGIKMEEEGKELDIPVEGAFIEIGSLPVSAIVKDVKTNPYGEIIVDCKCRTNIPGIFAAGDVTDVPAKQIIVACGEGCKALLGAFEYLSTEKSV